MQIKLTLKEKCDSIKENSASEIEDRDLRFVENRT